MLRESEAGEDWLSVDDRSRVRYPMADADSEAAANCDLRADRRIRILFHFAGRITDSLKSP